MSIKRKKIKSKNKSLNKTHIILILIIVTLIYLFISGDQGFIKYIKLQQEKRELIEHIEQLKKEHDELINEIDLLTNNYHYIEKVVREQHQMGKNGEKIYIMTSPKE